MIHAVAAVLAAATLHTAGFHTPSGNIRCEGLARMVRCDVDHQSNPRPRKPRSCDFDFGSAYGLTPGGRGRRPCVSDAVVGTRPVLRYGRAWSRFGIRCASRRSGLTCRNPRGHGFFLSRSRQRVF